MFKGKKSLFLTVAAFLTLAGCSETQSSSGTSSNKGQTGSKGQQVTLTISWWGAAARNDKMNKMLNLYQKQHPNVKIIRETNSFNDYWPKLDTEVAGGNLPDIFELHMNNYGLQYLSKGIAEPLDSYVKSGAINLKGWDKAVIDAGSYNGKFYGLADGATINSLFVNPDLVSKLGLPQPKEEMTYQDFKDFAQQAVAKLPKGDYVLSQDPSLATDGNALISWFRQKGHDLFKSTKGTELGFTKSDLASFWQYWSDMRKMGAIPSPQVNQEQSGLPDQDSFFSKGQAIMFADPVNRASEYQAYLPGKTVNLVSWPLMENSPNKSGDVVQVPAYAMSKQSKNKEAAAELMNFLKNNPETNKIYGYDDGISANQTIRNDLNSSLSPVDQKAVKLYDKLSTMIPKTTLRPSGSGKILNLYLQYAQQVAYGKSSINDAVNQFFSQADTVLKQQ